MDFEEKIVKGLCLILIVLMLVCLCVVAAGGCYPPLQIAA